MKLISFAVLSLLAITVSAYPGLGSDGQDLEESQGNSAQGEQQLQNTVTQGEQGSQSTSVTQDELKAEYKEVILLMNTLAGEFGSIKATITLVKESRDDTKAQLEDDDLSDEQRLTLEKQLGDYETELGELFSQLTSTLQYHSDARKEHDSIKEKMDALPKVQ